MAAPPGSDPTITFLSGVAVAADGSDATVAPISFGSWIKLNQNPPTYDPAISSATKWGSTTLLPGGTPGGNVSYWFDTVANQPGNVPWDDTAKQQWLSALDLWSAVANITLRHGGTGSGFGQCPPLKIEHEWHIRGVPQSAALDHRRQRGEPAEPTRHPAGKTRARHRRHRQGPAQRHIRGAVL